MIRSPLSRKKREGEEEEEGINYNITPSFTSDVDDDSFTFSKNNLLVLFVVVGLIILYLLFRVMFSYSSGSVGIANFKPETCYDISGFSTDAYFIQSRCWAELVKTKTKSTLYQPIFNYTPFDTRRDFDKHLKDLKKVILFYYYYYYLYLYLYILFLFRII